MTLAGLLAHNGGWDEALFVLLPIGLFGGLLTVANKRARSNERERERTDPDDPAGLGSGADDPDP